MIDWNVQTAIYAALSGVISAAVYDHVPQDTSYPYVTIGDDTTAEWGTDTEKGFDATITIHTWTREDGRKANKLIQKEIYDILHRGTVVVTDGTALGCDWEYSDTVLDPDGHTYHGVQRFRIFIDEG